MKHPYRQYKQSWRWSYRITGILAIVFMLVAVLGFYLVQRILLRNAQEILAIAEAFQQATVDKRGKGCYSKHQEMR